MSSVGIRRALVVSLSMLASGCIFHFPEYTWEREETRLELSANLSGTQSFVNVGVRSTEYPKSAAKNRTRTEQLCTGDGFGYMAVEQLKPHLAPGDSMEPRSTIRADGLCDQALVLKFKDFEKIGEANPFQILRTENRLTVEMPPPPTPAEKESADKPPKDDRPESLVVHYAGRILEHNATQVDAQTGRLIWDLKAQGPRPRFVLDAPR